MSKKIDFKVLRASTDLSQPDLDMQQLYSGNIEEVNLW